MQIEKQTFKKQERLKSRKIIKELFDCGKIIHQYPYKVLYVIEKAENSRYPVQIAISVSKKNFKRATDRNYLKRKTREAYRRNKHVLYEELNKSDQNLYFFVIYTAKHDLHFNDLDQEMKNLIQKLKHKLNRSQAN
jgi:ribonuclease P protein component